MSKFVERIRTKQNILFCSIQFVINNKNTFFVIFVLYMTQISKNVFQKNFFLQSNSVSKEEKSVAKENVLFENNIFHQKVIYNISKRMRFHLKKDCVSLEKGCESKKGFEAEK